jgi:hypothetical protein
MMHKAAVEKATELKWLRSSYSSSGDGNDCVEVAAAPGTVHVRGSKDLPGPRLRFGPTAWDVFLAYSAS